MAKKKTKKTPPKKTRKKKKKSPGFLSLTLRALQNYLAGPAGPRIGRALCSTTLVAVFLLLIAVGLGILERYVLDLNQARNQHLDIECQFQDPPAWASQMLIHDVCTSTGIQAEQFFASNDVVHQWYRNLAANPWVEDINLLRRRYDGRLEIDCTLRRPVAALRHGPELYYLDSNGVVLPAVPLAGHLVRLQGERLRSIRPGDTITSPALLAGLAVLKEIRNIDEQQPRQDRLWEELATMDVSNFQGRINSAESHLVMYTANNTEIRWGVAFGRAGAFFEAPEETKLRRLYLNHAKYNTLGVYEYVDLRNRRQDFADPLRNDS